MGPFPGWEWTCHEQLQMRNLSMARELRLNHQHNPTFKRSNSSFVLFNFFLKCQQLFFLFHIVLIVIFSFLFFTPPSSTTSFMVVSLCSSPLSFSFQKRIEKIINRLRFFHFVRCAMVTSLGKRKISYLAELLCRIMQLQRCRYGWITRISRTIVCLHFRLRHTTLPFLVLALSLFALFDHAFEFWRELLRTLLRLCHDCEREHKAWNSPRKSVTKKNSFLIIRRNCLCPSFNQRVCDQHFPWI